ncbi:MAG TPA: hypothetical protein VFU41_15135 [Gemmatimonadales bacterium]|nr:hypothetical protein [Gemmatimonadales bacterium]
MSRFFVLKAWLGGIAVACGLLGMALAWRWLVGIAAALLLVAFLLRFAEGKPREP